MSENSVITVWRLLDSFNNSNQMRDEFISKASGGEYLGTRLHSVGIAPAALGWAFRFIDSAAAESFRAEVESHDLPDDPGVVVEQQEHEDDDVMLIRPGTTEPISVKRKRVDNLLAKGWVRPGDAPSSAPVPKKKKKKKKKQEVKEPVRPTPFVEHDDDIIVMVTPDAEFVEVKRKDMPSKYALRWMTGWDYYRQINIERKQADYEYQQRLRSIEESIEAIKNKYKSKDKK